MTWKQLESRRETRLWITQVIIPGAAIVAAVMNIPEARNAVITKYQDIKTKIKTKLDKK